jgi:hypothetical protein
MSYSLPIGPWAELCAILLGGETTKDLAHPGVGDRGKSSHPGIADASFVVSHLRFAGTTVWQDQLGSSRGVCGSAVAELILT